MFLKNGNTLGISSPNPTYFFQTIKKYAKTLPLRLRSKAATATANNKIPRLLRIHPFYKRGITTTILLLLPLLIAKQ
jgi:hypothetical protein